MVHFVVLYGGKVVDGKLNPDSAVRCDVAVRVASRYPDSIIIFSVDHTIPNLRNITINHLVYEEGWPSERLMLRSVGHNSLMETESAIDVLAKYGSKEATVVSSWYHLPRIWMIWRLLGWKGKLRFGIGYTTSTPVESLLRELVAVPLNIFRIFRKTIRRFRNA